MMLLALLISCEKQEPEPEPIPEPLIPHVTQEIYRDLHVGQTMPIKGDNLQDLEWEFTNSFVAEVDASQCIVPKHVGFSWAFADGEGKYRVVTEVTPKYKDYDLPVLYKTATYEGIIYDSNSLFSLGSPDITQIKGYEKRTLDSRSNNGLLIYKTGNPKSPYVVYMFNKSYLESCGTIIDPIYASNLPDFLKERYEVISVDLTKPSAYFLHKNGPKGYESTDLIGGLQYFSQLGGLLLVFTKNEGTKASSFDSTIVKLAKQIEDVLNN